MVIRTLNEEDIKTYRESIYELLDICFRLTYETISADVIESKIDGLIQHIKDGRAYTIGAIAENQMIAFLWGYPVTTPAEKVFHIAYIAVGENGRRQGIGKKLMHMAESIAKELGLRNVELMVGSKNEGAISFYEKEDYKPDRIIMRKQVW